jgi:diguanylate cyclase (GGDEF)-like protein
MDIKQLLKNAELFSSLHEDDLDFIAQNTDIKEFTQDLAQYSAGESFGEFGFITGALHDVEAEAKSDSKLLVFPAFPQTLESLSLEKPGTMCRLYLKSVEILSKRSNTIHSAISENSPWVKQFQDQMYIDQLTGLYKKQYLESEIPRFLKLPVTVLVLKPDRFKDLNERYGHQAGDAVLTRIGMLLIETAEKRAEGFAVRIQSNEMALVLFQTDTEEALDIARNLGKTIRTIGPSLPSESGNASKGTSPDSDLRLTASISIGIYRDKKKDFSQFVTGVYRSMFLNWKEGGNKISIIRDQHDRG